MKIAPTPNYAADDTSPSSEGHPRCFASDETAKLRPAQLKAGEPLGSGRAQDTRAKRAATKKKARLFQPAVRRRASRERGKRALAVQLAAQ